MAWLSFVMMLAVAGATPVQDENEAIKTKSGEVGMPATGFGQVVFFRPRALMWAVMGCGAFEDDTQLTKLGIGKYHIVPVQPGKHLYHAGKDKKLLHIQVVAGQTYFIKCRIASGLIGRGQVVRSDRDEFIDEAAGLSVASTAQ